MSAAWAKLLLDQRLHFRCCLALKENLKQEASVPACCFHRASAAARTPEWTVVALSLAASPCGGLPGYGSAGVAPLRLRRGHC
jgi:hypothetical protein